MDSKILSRRHFPPVGQGVGQLLRPIEEEIRVPDDADPGADVVVYSHVSLESHPAGTVHANICPDGAVDYQLFIGAGSVSPAVEVAVCQKRPDQVGVARGGTGQGAVSDIGIDIDIAGDDKRQEITASL